MSFDFFSWMFSRFFYFLKCYVVVVFSPDPLSGPERNNVAYSSFRRQLSIAGTLTYVSGFSLVIIFVERKMDPQTAIINNPPPPPISSSAQQQQQFHALPSQALQCSASTSQVNPVCLPYSASFDDSSSVAKPRPVANPLLFERQVCSYHIFFIKMSFFTKD